MLVILLLVGVLSLFYYYAIKPMTYWTERGVKQKKPLWLFGNSLGQLLRRCTIPQMFQEIYDSHLNARYIGFYQFTVPILLLKDTKLIKQITVKEFDHFTDHRQFINPEADVLWARNLLSLQGKEWKEMRPILSPSYTSNKMRMMYVLMKDCAEDFVNFFLNKEENTINVNMKDISTRFANDVIATAAFGLKVDSLREPNNEFYLMGKQATDVSSFIKNTKLLAGLVFRDLHKYVSVQIFDEPSRSFFSNLIMDTIKIREEKGIVRPDLIHLLMEAKKGVNENDENGASIKETSEGKNRISNTDIISQALIFFFAGFESISSLITFMAYELAVNSDVQKRLREEVEATFEECKGDLSYEVLLKMKYLDMVVSETLRKWPSFPGTDRLCTKSFTIEPELPDEKPVVIEKGTVLELPMMALHYDPKYFPNPTVFDPERFSEANKDKLDPYAYFPFGLGPRICIGSRFAVMEAKTLFAHLLINYEIVPTSETVIPVQLSRKHFNLYPNDGVCLGFRRLK